MSIALITHANCLDHNLGAYHPESPERVHAIQDRLISSGLEVLLKRYDAPLAHQEHLMRVHDSDYLDGIENAIPDHDDTVNWLDGDTGLTHHTIPAALRAAGAAVLAVDLVMNQETAAAFCLVRPPGHHAERRRAMGFCIYNNIAVAAAHALEHYGLERVAIVDFDVHHGNGTEDIFINDERVLFCSSFQHPFYPYMGADTQAPNILNLPMPAGTTGAAFRKAIEQSWLPRLNLFKPQLVLISAGFDGHAEDGMSQFGLREPDYAWITRHMHDLAAKYADGRIISCLEGGYDFSSLGRSVAVHIDELIGQH